MAWIKAHEDGLPPDKLPPLRQRIKPSLLERHSTAPPPGVDKPSKPTRSTVAAGSA